MHYSDYDYDKRSLFAMHYSDSNYDKRTLFDMVYIDKRSLFVMASMFLVYSLLKVLVSDTWICCVWHDVYIIIET